MIRRELPPTAGLPLSAKDFIAGFFARDGISFELQLAQFLSVEQLDIYSSGTLCLSLAFETLKEISGRNRVIIPGYTCPLVPIAAHAAGVEVVLCDTKKDSFELDPIELERICDRSIAAIVPTYIAGLPTSLRAEKAIAAACGSYVIEDAAQALGARFGDSPVGNSADISVFSLAVGKGLSLFDGGIVCVKDAAIRSKLRDVAARRIKNQSHLNLYRQLQILGLYFFYNPGGLEFVYGQPLRNALAKGDLLEAVGEHFELEIPSYKFDEYRKRMGASMLQRLPKFVESNRQRGMRRAQLINNRGQFKVLAEVDGAEGSWPFLMLLAESQEQRDAVMEKLWQSGLGVTRLFINELPTYDYLRSIVPQVEVPNAHSFASKSFSITNSHWLSESEFEKIMDCMSAANQSQIRSAAS